MTNFKRLNDFKVLLKYLHKLYFVDKFKGTIEISSIDGMSHNIKPRPSHRIVDLEHEMKDYNIDIDAILSDEDAGQHKEGSDEIKT